MTPGLRLGILGPLEAVADGVQLDLGGPKQRALIAVLALNLGRVVPAGRLIDALWGPAPPAAAEVTLRTHVSHLRKRLLPADVLVTERPGYRLRLAPEQVDAYRFERTAGLGQESLGLGDPQRAADLLREALAQWRGPVLEDLGYPEFAAAETARLDELRLVALEGRIEADLALGRHQGVTSELEALVADHPYRERFCGQLMLALYRSGRQVDALTVYAAARQRLADELGLDPGPALAELETAILRHDPALAPRADHAAHPAGTPASAPPDALLSVARRVRLVGRSAELDRLLDLWRAVRDGDRRVVVVSGEAGVGKTRLVAEFVHLVAADPAVFLVGRCDHATTLPYQPVADALRSSVDAAGVLAGAPEAVRDRLAALLDLPAESRADARAEDREAVFGAVGWVLEQLVAVAPVAVVVERPNTSTGRARCCSRTWSDTRPGTCGGSRLGAARRRGPLQAPGHRAGHRRRRAAGVVPRRGAERGRRSQWLPAVARLPDGTWRSPPPAGSATSPASTTSPGLVDAARRRAAAEDLDIDFRVADAENLPFSDDSFDYVFSAIGVMFTADHQRAADELVRVCRPGGRIAIASWTPAGFVGQLLKTVSRHAPPPPGALPPPAGATRRPCVHSWPATRSRRPRRRSPRTSRPRSTSPTSSSPTTARPTPRPPG